MRIALLHFYTLCSWSGLLTQASGLEIDPDIVKALKGVIDFDPCHYWAQWQADYECTRAGDTFKKIPEELRGPCRKFTVTSCHRRFLYTCTLYTEEGDKIVLKSLASCIEDVGIKLDPICPTMPCKKAPKKRTRKINSWKWLSRKSSNDHQKELTTNQDQPIVE